MAPISEINSEVLKGIFPAALERFKNFNIPFTFLLGDDHPVAIGESPFSKRLRESAKFNRELQAFERKLFADARERCEVFWTHDQLGFSVYAAPVFLGQTYIGLIYSPSFKCSPQKIQEISREYGLDFPTLKKAYSQSLKANKSFKEETVRILSEFLHHFIEIEAQNGFLSDALAARDDNALLQLFVERIPNLTWRSYCSVFLLDTDKKKFVLAATTSESMKSDVGDLNYLPGEGLTGWVGQHGHPLLVLDVRDKEEIISRVAGTDLPTPEWSGCKTGKGKKREHDGDIGYTVMLVPIQSQPGGFSTGVIRLAPIHLPNQDNARRIPTQSDMDLFMRIARLIYAAVENRAVRNILNSRSFMEALVTLDFDVLMEVFVDMISRQFNSFVTQIRFHDRLLNIWYILAINNGPYSKAIEARGSVKATQDRDNLFNKGEYYIDNNIKNSASIKRSLAQVGDTDPTYSEYLKSLGAALVLPIRNKEDDSIVARLHLRRRIGQKFSDEDAKEVSEIVGQLQNLVDTMRQFDQKRGEDHVLRGIVINELIFNPNELLQAILRNAMDAVGADLALARRVVDQSACLMGVQFRDSVVPPGHIPETRKIGEGGSGLAAQVDQTVFIADTSREAVYGDIPQDTSVSVKDPETAEFDNWIGSEIAVPVRVGEVVRVITVVSGERNKFSTRDLDVMNAFAEKAIIILHCAHLIQNESSVRIKTWKMVAGKASHQVVNRLTGIGAYLQYMSAPTVRPLLPLEVGKGLNPAKSSLEDARTFLNDFTRFSADDPLKLKSESLCPIIDSAIQESPLPGAVSVHGLNEKIPRIPCDFTSLKHCFSELIQNSHEAGATRIKIEVEYLEASNALQIAFRDNGPGIPKEQQESVFLPSKTSKPDGTGLGLSIVRDIIQQHQGTIFLKNPSTSGAFFLIYLPIWFSGDN